MSDLELLLGQHPFSSTFEVRYFQRLVRCAQLLDAEQGEYLWRQGDPAERLFLLCEGAVSLEISLPHLGPVRIETINAREIVGSAWEPTSRWPFDARAIEPVKAAVLDMASIRRLSDGDPAFGYEFLKRVTPVVARRLQSARLRRFEDMTGSAAPTFTGEATFRLHPAK